MGQPTPSCGSSETVPCQSRLAAPLIRGPKHLDFSARYVIDLPWGRWKECATSRCCLLFFPPRRFVRYEADNVQLQYPVSWSSTENGKISKVAYPRTDCVVLLLLLLLAGTDFGREAKQQILPFVSATLQVNVYPVSAANHTHIAAAALPLWCSLVGAGGMFGPKWPLSWSLLFVNFAARSFRLFWVCFSLTRDDTMTPPPPQILCFPRIADIFPRVWWWFGLLPRCTKTCTLSLFFLEKCQDALVMRVDKC